MAEKELIYNGKEKSVDTLSETQNLKRKKNFCKPRGNCNSNSSAFGEYPMVGTEKVCFYAIVCL